MGLHEHPRPALTADVVAIRDRGKARRVLLVLRGRPPYEGRWALPGGFVDAFELPEAAARRELAEETGLAHDGPLDLVGVYGEPGRDPRGWTVSAVYLAVLAHEVPVGGGDDAAEAGWFPADALPPLAFDHHVIVGDALAVLHRGRP
jgi:8-oxo-dGTP diphosphatase